jgi:hypothetical protein
MNEVLNSGAFNLASLVISLVVNRASSRANEQMELLEALLDQQKRQNALLRRLCDANVPEKAEPEAKAAATVQTDGDDFIRLVAER